MSKELADLLPRFIGTEGYHPFSNGMVSTYLTDGAEFFRKEANANWLFLLILDGQKNHDIHGQEFQTWKVVSNADHTKCAIRVTDGNENELAKFDVEYTISIDEVEFWYTDNIVLLPSEY